MASVETELDLLESIYRSTATPRQRDLAQALGLSLGMTNVILKRMARKGWLAIRKVNNRNIQYVVSRSGIEAITRRSYRYLRRTVRDMARYREAIVRLVHQAAARGCREVVLVGQSDLDFIFEHACVRTGLGLSQVAADRRPAPRGTPTRLVVLSERVRSPAAPAEGEVLLANLLGATTAVRRTEGLPAGRGPARGSA